MYASNMNIEKLRCRVVDFIGNGLVNCYCNVLNLNILNNSVTVEDSKKNIKIFDLDKKGIYIEEIF